MTILKIKILLCIIWLASFQSFSPYQVLPFQPSHGLEYRTTLISKDLSKMITMSLTASTTPTRHLYMYNLDQQGKIQLINEFVRADTSSSLYYLRADQNLDMILTHSSSEKKANVYRRNGVLLHEVQPEFNPHLTNNLNSVQMSSDGSFINFGTTSGTNPLLISYQWNGTDYVSFFNGTIAAMSPFRAISPDGLYLVYGQTGTLNLRVINNLSPTQQYTSINLITLTTGTITTTPSIPWVGVGQAGSGKYDIICRYIFNGIDSVVYIQFDNATNTLTIPSPQYFPNPDPSGNWDNKFFLTTNGKFLLIVYRTLIRLFQKKSGQYIEVYNDTKVSTQGRLIYVAEDASLIVIAPASGSRIHFLFKCDVFNCFTCAWINVCKICNTGYVLHKNVCVCAAEMFSLSGICVNCSIQNCVSCTGNRICSNCGNGYTLINNTCVCPLPMNLSSVTSKCVTCNVVNCYQCSHDDVCAVFKPVQSSINEANLLKNIEKTSESVDRIQQRIDSKIQTILVALLVLIGVLLIGMVIISLVLAKLMKQVPNSTSLKPETSHTKNFTKTMNKTSIQFKDECQNESFGRFGSFQSDQKNEGEEQLQNAGFQSQNLSQPTISLTMSNVSTTKTKSKERNRRKLNNYAIEQIKDMHYLQSLSDSLPANVDSTEVINLS